jgi:hypothetical protein
MSMDADSDADVEAARAAILARDLPDAVRRLGGIVARAPKAPTTRELVARLGFVVVDADLVAPPSAKPFHGEAMVRALLLARAERYTEAATLLIEADAAAPDRGYFEAFAYLGEDCPLVEGVDAARIGSVALAVMRRGPCTASLFAFLVAVRDRWPGVELAMMAATRALQLRG